MILSKNLQWKEELKNNYIVKDDWNIFKIWVIRSISLKASMTFSTKWYEIEKDGI